MLVLLTDGLSQDRVGLAAGRMKATGVEVFAIGLGKKVKHRQLRLIATDRTHAMTTSFSTLMTLIIKLKNQICQKLREWNVFSS